MFAKFPVKEKLKSISSFIFLDWKNKHGEIKLWKITLYCYLFIQFFFSVYFDSYIMQVQEPHTKMDKYMVIVYDFDNQKTRTLEVEDSLLYGVYDAPGMFEKLKKDKLYHVKTVGIRIPFPYFKFFPNIISLKEISLSKGE